MSEMTACKHGTITCPLCESEYAAALEVVEAGAELAVHVPNGTAADPYKAAFYRAKAWFDATTQPPEATLSEQDEGRRR